MNTEISNDIKLQRAKQRVKVLKGFYQHLTAYVLVNVGLLLFAKQFTFVVLSKEALGNPDFLKWIDWNIWGTPIIWGIALGIHAISVFVKSPFKNWEDRQIQKMMKKDQNENNRFDVR